MAKVDFKKLFQESVDVDQFTGDLTTLFKSVVSDVTDPQFKKIISDLAADASDIIYMKTEGASDEVVKEAMDSAKALGASALQIPGLIAANKQAAFLAILGNVAESLVNFGFKVLAAYTHIPVDTIIQPKKTT